MARHATIDEYLASLTAPLGDIGGALRGVLDAGLDHADGTIWHGHPVWMSGKAPLAGFKAYTSHVTFMIWHGNAIADPAGRLETGTHMASLKLRSTTDIDRALFTSWVRTAHAV